MRLACALLLLATTAAANRRAPWPLPAVVQRLVAMADNAGRPVIGVEDVDGGRAVVHGILDVRLPGTDDARGARAILEPRAGGPLVEMDPGRKQQRRLTRTYRDQGAEVRLRIDVHGGIKGGSVGGVDLRVTHQRLLPAAQASDRSFRTAVALVPPLGQYPLPPFLRTRLDRMPVASASLEAESQFVGPFLSLTLIGPRDATRSALVAEARAEGWELFEESPVHGPRLRKTIGDDRFSYFNLRMDDPPDRLSVSLQAR